MKKINFLFSVVIILLLSACRKDIETDDITTSTPSIPIIENSWDKLNHFIAFFVLYILLYSGFKIFTILANISLLMLFAIQIEIVQYFIPNRYFSLLDVLADGVGVLIAILVISFYNKYIKVKDNSYIRL